MTTRKIYLASPIEPSGASWLINCLLELGIRVDHKAAVERMWRTDAGPVDPGRLWQRDGAHWRPHPRGKIMGKWLPALTTRDRFTFRDDIHVEYIQEFPNQHHVGQCAALFLRDPRDAIYSHYRRRQSTLDFAGFAALPNPCTLLDAATHWRLYVQSWRALTDGRVYRFEDYKADDEGLLRRILADLGIDAGEDEVRAAAAASTFEKAQAGEASYRARHPGDAEVANRAGKVGDAGARPDIGGVTAAIARRCADVLGPLGYAVPDLPEAASSGPPPGAAQFHLLDVFRDYVIGPEATALAAAEPLASPDVPALLDFARGLDASTLAAAAFSPRDARALLASLGAFNRAHAAMLDARLDRLGVDFADGSSRHMGVLRDLLRRSRRARKG